jgi:hypothetical protein
MLNKLELHEFARLAAEFQRLVVPEKSLLDGEYMTRC